MSWRFQNVVAASVVCVGLLGSTSAALAQQAPVNVGRDCQTVVNCNYKRGGVFRGCVSSFSCRRCRFVTARCKIGNDRRTCRKLKCGWGG